MVQYESVLTGEQQVVQLVILKVNQSLLPVPSKDTLTVGIEMVRRGKKWGWGNKVNNHVLSSDPVSVTDWVYDLQQVLSCTASFSLV